MLIILNYLLVFILISFFKLSHTMKNFLLLFLLILGCSKKQNSGFNALWTIKEVNVNSYSSIIHLKIENNTDTNLNGGNWSLHWNQIGGQISNSSLPKGIFSKRINGDYYVMDFSSDYNLGPGDKLEFTFKLDGILERIIFGPLGVFIHSIEKNTNYSVESKIEWKNAKGMENQELPNALSRFEDNKDILNINYNDLGLVIPSPKNIFLKKEEFKIPKDFRIYLPDLYIENYGVINTVLSDEVGIKTKISNSRNDSDILVVHDDNFDDENYSLDISNNLIKITTSSSSGLLYSINSIAQLLMNSKIEGKNHIPSLEIIDGPRFKYRGIHFDISRNFYGVDKIKQLLDYMFYFKLNKFHLNITDDEGWRIEIPGLPELTEIGSKRGFTKDESQNLNPAYGSGYDVKALPGSGYLKREEFIDIIKYADERNIELIPEINFPAHSRAAIKSMLSRYNRFMELGDIESAEQYLLTDFNDKSEYMSAQRYNDNVLCVCRESTFNFIKKLIDEIELMFLEANSTIKTFHIGGDELPYGAWKKSPICSEFLSSSSEFNSVEDLPVYFFKEVVKILSQKNISMAGWEDILLVHTEDVQNATKINSKFKDDNITPYVWNNVWGGGREDMIYKFANMDFNVIMSNSAAFYFDMTDDKDPENYGLSWSGYVSYKDSWLTEPLNVYAKTYLNSNFKKYRSSDNVILEEDKISNFRGIQGQMWTETVRTEKIFDELMYPNLIILAEKAWSKQNEWSKDLSNLDIDNLMNLEWSNFVNTLGHRTLHHLSELFGGVDFDLPKPGGIIINDTLYSNTIFPGMDIRFSRDGSTPTYNNEIYDGKVYIKPSEKIVFRLFNKNGRGGRYLELDRIYEGETYLN